jgi:hypothetical protein
MTGLKNDIWYIGMRCCVSYECILRTLKTSTRYTKYYITLCLQTKSSLCLPSLPFQSSQVLSCPSQMHLQSVLISGEGRQNQFTCGSKEGTQKTRRHYYAVQSLFACNYILPPAMTQFTESNALDQLCICERHLNLFREALAHLLLV